MMTVQEKCMISNALNVELMHKYLSNQMVKDLCIVEIVIKNKEDQDTRMSL